MTTDDLSKLRIDRSLAPVQTRRRRKWLWLGGIAAAVVLGGAWVLLQPRALAVQTTPIVTTYPSQQFVVLNSTGYVVAQRKAAISSKASGGWNGSASPKAWVRGGGSSRGSTQRDVSAARRRARQRQGRARGAGERSPKRAL